MQTNNTSHVYRMHTGKKIGISEWLSRSLRRFPDSKVTKQSATFTCVRLRSIFQGRFYRRDVPSAVSGNFHFPFSPFGARFFILCADTILGRWIFRTSRHFGKHWNHRRRISAESYCVLCVITRAIPYSLWRCWKRETWKRKILMGNQVSELVF